MDILYMDRIVTGFYTNWEISDQVQSVGAMLLLEHYIDYQFPWEQEPWGFL
jgi:hypothetical protein